MIDRIKPKLLSQRISLRWALLLYVVVPLAVALGITGYQVLRTLEDWIEKRLQEEIALVARTLQLPLSGALKRYDRHVLDEALESAFRISRVFGVYLYGVDGRNIAAVGVEETLPLARELVTLATNGEAWGGYGRVAGQDVYSYFVPLTDAGAVIGVLRVTRRASDFQDYLADLHKQALLWLITAILMMATLVLLGHYMAIGGPLQRLVSSMTKVTAGNRNHRTSIQGPWEIAVLGTALNRMLDSIARAEQELEHRYRRQTELERRLHHAETMASLGCLAGGVAHELGTPLSVVDGKAQRLLRRTPCSASLVGPLREIRQEVRRMEQIVRQLLEFGRNQGNHRHKIAADQLAKLALTTVRQAFEDSKTTLTIAGCTSTPLLFVNTMRVEQALVNLLHNARQATPGGQVRLSWFCTKEMAEFRVEDDGPGIPDHLKHRVLEPFFTTKEVGQGSGLGLAIVDSVAREHDGSLEVFDSVLGGAGFLLRLPRINQENGNVNANHAYRSLS